MVYRGRIDGGALDKWEWRVRDGLYDTVSEQRGSVVSVLPDRVRVALDDALMIARRRESPNEIAMAPCCRLGYRKVVLSSCFYRRDRLQGCIRLRSGARLHSACR